MTKSGIQECSRKKKDVALVLDELGVVMERHIKRRAVGTFTLPGLLKIKTARKPAAMERKMIGPFTAQEIARKGVVQACERDRGTEARWDARKLE